MRDYEFGEEVMAMVSEFELRLRNPAVPEGEVRLVDLIRCERWQPRSVTRDEEIVISGVLRAVDNRGRFRIRDDVGNRIPLEDVADADRAAYFINRRVTATGMALRGDNGALRAVSRPVIAAEELPRAWVAGEADDWTSELEKPGPDLDGGITLTDEDFQAFVSAMGR